MKWTENYRINSHDCDSSGKVRPSLILRYMQETANLQLRALGPTRDELLRDDRAFILSRINMSIYANLYAYENITVSSWACESRGVSFNRCYQIRSNGELIAEAASVWGLIGISDRKIYRVEDVILGFDTDEPLEIDTPKRVRIPRDIPLSLVGERPIVYSDLDVNQHMNNTNYPDMLCDFIPDAVNKRMLNISISFAGEAKLGETLKVYMNHSDDQYFFRTVRADGSVNVEAVLMIDN